MSWSDPDFKITILGYLMSNRPNSKMIQDRARVKIGGGYGGWTPTGKQITPLQTPGKKARGSGLDPPWA